MVKRIFMSLIALTIAISGFAQGIPPTHPDESVILSDETVTLTGGDVPKQFALSIGPKIGFNLAMANDPYELDLGTSGSMGFNAGAAMNIRFWKRPLTRWADTGRMGLQVEAMYATHSLKTDYGNIKMNCYEIPMLLQWWFAKDFAVEAGTTFTGSFATSPETINYNNMIYHTGKIKGYDAMLTVGVEYKSQIGLTASVRYNIGNSSLAGNFNTSVSTLSIGIGWLFTAVK